MNTFGENIKISMFGEARGPAMGIVLDGLPAGEKIDLRRLREDARQRPSGASEVSGRRDDTGEPFIMSGVIDGRTTGAPLCIAINNPRREGGVYRPNIPRPGQADLTARIKYGPYADFRGGGAFGSRIMPLFALAGAVCRQILERRGVFVSCEIVQAGRAKGHELDFGMKKEILDARSRGDSVGGVIECAAHGVPAGLGSMLFGGLSSRISAMMFAVPGAVGVEFGAGFGMVSMPGSQANDPIRIDSGNVYTETNFSGGINGGITNGMPLVVRLAVRPTPSIGREQKTVNLRTMENITIRAGGRHDPCYALRAAPAAAGALAFCILDAMEL